MSTDDKPRGFDIDDPDTSEEDAPFAIEDEATVDTGSIPPPAHEYEDGAPTDRPPPPPPPDGPAEIPLRIGGLRTPAEIAALVDEGRALVDPAARRVYREVGGLTDVEELASVGRFAIVEAARHFDPQRSRFAAYANQRLRWAMYDHVRRDTQRRGSARMGTALAVAERVLEARREPPPGADLPTEESARVALADALASHAGALAVGLVLGSAQLDPSPDSTMNPERAVGDRRNVERLRLAIAALPDPQRALIERHHFGGERFDHIAESLGLSKSWVSRLHSQAIAALAKALVTR